MARSLDIETLIEDAIITHLQSYVGSSVTVKRWEDIKEKDLTPVVKVKAMADEEPGTINLYCAYNVNVDIGVFSGKRIDEDGKTSSAIRASVREFLNQDNVVTLLNQEAGLLVYNNGVIPQGTTDLSDDKIYQKVMNVLIVATTTT